MIHALKIEPVYFKEIESGRKTFELRKFDRPFCEGDKLLLQEWDGDYTRNEVMVQVTYILHFNEKTDCEKFGLNQGFCILGIRFID